MPVSLSEWRVRIGTFVHWIREFEVKERRERLLKERIRRLKVLCERLNTKRGDSKEGSQDDRSRQNGPDPKGCPHKIANIQSSGNSSDIKDLLTSCDQCIQDLLTASDSHIKEILTPSDGCIKQLLAPTDSNIRLLLSPTNSCRKDQHAACDSHDEDNTMLTPNYSNIRELIIHSDSCFRELHLSIDACKDDMISDSDVKDLLTPRDYAIIETLEPKEYCIYRLPTPRDSCIQELLTPRDSCIQELLTPRDSCIQELLTPRDSCIQELLTPRDSCIQELLTPRDSCIQELLTPRDSCIQELLTPRDSCIQELLTPRDSCIQELLTPRDSCIQELLTPRDSCIQELLTPRDSCIQELLTPRDSCIQELLTPRDYCIKELLTPTDSTIQELLTPRDSYIKELLTLRYSYTCEPLTPRDSCIQELLTPTDSCIRELLSVSSHIDESLSPGDGYIQELLTQKDSYTYEPLRDAYTNELFPPGHSYPNKSLRHRDSYIQELFAQRDSSIRELLTLTDFYTNGIISPTNSYIEEIFTPGDSLTDESVTPIHSNTNVSLTPIDSNTHVSFTPGDCFTNKLLTQGDSYIQDFLKPRESYIHELLAPRDTYTNESHRPGDSYIQDFLPPIDSVIRELLTTGETSTNESLTGGDSYIKELLTPRESYIRELLTPRDFYTNEPLTPGDSYTNKSYTDVELKLPRQEDKQISPTSSLESGAIQHGPFGGKEMANTASRSSCQKTDILKGTDDVMISQQPYLTELLLVKAGDVELNPGPLDGSIDSVLQESELIRLADEVQGDCYYKLCNGLGFSLTQSKNRLTQHHFNHTGALIEFFCGWKVRQRDGTNCRVLLGEILQNADMDALQTKLLKGEYLTSGTSPSDPILDTSQTILTESQVFQCGEDLKTFYSEEMCKIKPDPLDFNIIVEFEQIYTNLTLLRKDMGTQTTEKPLDYTNLLTTKINGVLPKRLLVEGEGGVGKTTFCSKIAWDWVNGSSEFQRFSWVLVIPLRNVVKGQTIGDIMKNYLSDNNAVHPKQIDNYILSQPTKVLIVLDGLDEYEGDLSAKESSDISQILRLEKFKKCVVLVTTRPWRADKIKSNEGLSRLYAFIAVKGFSAKNVSTYISKYFVKDEKAGSELIRFINVNDVIKLNMAPFPIYVAMLCILWENCDSEKRETIRRLKTFSQLFDQMIMFLRDHYVSKVANLDKEMEDTKLCLQSIGSIAFSGLLTKKLVFNEEDFSSCKKAMEKCCRIGVLSRENRKVSRWKRTLTASQPITTCVFFPHKLFQEYIASVYLASLYDTNREEYSRSMGEVLSKNPQEFRYLLYFTAALGKEVGLDIVKKIQQNDVCRSKGIPALSRDRQGDFKYEQSRKTYYNFLVDVTFEAYNKDTAKAVGQQIFEDEKMLTIDGAMPAHTMSGYLYIMEQHGMETLVFENPWRSFGPTVSRDLADVLFTCSSLSRLEFYSTTLDDVFYQLMHKRVSKMAGDNSSIKELVVDHQFLNALQRVNNSDINVTVEDLFPSLTKLTFSTLHAVSPGDVERLAHSTLAELSIERGEKGRELVPLIGEPTLLGQLFSSSFPQLTCLTFRGLVMGNIRSEAILRNLKNHLHLKSISIISCFTDDELDLLAKQVTTENRMKVILQHDKAQRRLTFGCNMGQLTIDIIDTLCHRTCVHHLEVFEYGVKIAGEDCFPDFHGREVDSKIKRLSIRGLKLHDNQLVSSSMGKFLSLLPHLTDLGIESCDLHDDFYKEFANRASSNQIQKLSIRGFELHNNQSQSYCLGKFLSLLPHLTDVEICSCSLHDEFYKEFANRASSNQIRKFVADGLHLHNDQSQSYCLGKLLSFLPNLKELDIASCDFHDDFYKEIADQASPSQITVLGITDLKLHDKQLASCCLGKFLSLQSRLIGLVIMRCSLHGDFCKEIADRASSSQIRVLKVHGLNLHDEQSASFFLGKFISLLSQLTYLSIDSCSFHDDFFKEIADLASSCQIHTLIIADLEFHDNQLASFQLGKFLSLLSYLTDLVVNPCSLHDDFYKEMADRAFSSQIQTVGLEFGSSHDIPAEVLNHSASKQLATILCSLPCLTHFGFSMYEHIHDDFFTELGSLAASSKLSCQNPYFREKKHISMLQEWSERKHHQQKQQLMTSTQQEPYLPHHVHLLE